MPENQGEKEIRISGQSLLTDHDIYYSRKGAISGFSLGIENFRDPLVEWGRRDR
jgi:hypothetical protein